MANSTAISENRNENKSDELVRYISKFGIMRMPELKMLENVIKPKEKASTFHEDWDEIGTKMAKKGHLLLKSAINPKLVRCQWVNYPQYWFLVSSR